MSRLSKLSLLALSFVAACGGVEGMSNKLEDGSLATDQRALSQLVPMRITADIGYGGPVTISGQGFSNGGSVTVYMFDLQYNLVGQHDISASAAACSSYRGCAAAVGGTFTLVITGDEWVLGYGLCATVRVLVRDNASNAWTGTDVPSICVFN